MSNSTPEQKLDIEKLLGYEFEPKTFTYTERDVSLYALGIGAAKDALDPKELQFVYEYQSSGFNVFPTFAVTFWGSMIHDTVSIPGFNVNPMMLLHGEQYLELIKPLPVSGTVINRGKIAQIYDKGKGAFIVIDMHSEDENGTALAFNQYGVYARDFGDFGGDRGPSTTDLNLPPDREPDAVVEETVAENQALLYRLAGDWNPLHADPAMAAMGGFPRPILHGLCTFGHAARSVVKQFCDNDPKGFRNIKVRFAKHVFPGETLVTEMWQDEANLQIVFQTKVVERDVYVLTNAAVGLNT